MPGKLLNTFLLGRCSHEFSWPRRAEDGRYYQVCLLCAVEYGYDWKSMRRTGRIQRSGEAQPAVRRGRACSSKKSSWTPRGRRLRVQTGVRYREKGQSGWYVGMIENISQSGVLFQGEHCFPEHTILEMVFEMPIEISGQPNSNVLCNAMVVRSRLPSERCGATLAASIADYKFLHQEQV